MSVWFRRDPAGRFGAWGPGKRRRAALSRTFRRACPRFDGSGMTSDAEAAYPAPTSPTPPVTNGGKPRSTESGIP